MFRAVLDTCALVPGHQRDFLLQLATEGAYAPLWGTGILFELDYVLAELDQRRGHLDSEDRRRRLFAAMNDAFPGAVIDAPKIRDYSYDLLDDDGHVAHAAIIGKADAIVTDDRRAGCRTSSVLAAADIEVLPPAEFAANTVAAHPELGARAVRALSQRRKHPPQSPLEVLDELRHRYQMTEVFDLVASLFSEGRRFRDLDPGEDKGVPRASDSHGPGGTQLA